MVVKWIEIERKEVEISLFVDDMIIYISDPKNATREFVQLINKLTKVVDIRLIQGLER